MWIYFLEVKNIAFPLDLFSQIDLFKIFRLDYFSRTNQLRTLRICFLQTVYVVVNFRLSMTSELLLIFVMFFVSERTESFQIIQQIKRRIGGTRQTCSPVSFNRKLIGQIINFYFSNSLVNTLAEPLVKMLAKMLKMLAEGLVSMLTCRPSQQ